MNGGVDLTFFHDVMEMEPGRTGNNTEITEPEIRLFLHFSQPIFIQDTYIRTHTSTQSTDHSRNNHI